MLGEYVIRLRDGAKPFALTTPGRVAVDRSHIARRRANRVVRWHGSRTQVDFQGQNLRRARETE